LGDLARKRSGLDLANQSQKIFVIRKQNYLTLSTYA
jgi:hypothetical protein